MGTEAPIFAVVEYIADFKINVIDVAEVTRSLAPTKWTLMSSDIK